MSVNDTFSKDTTSADNETTFVSGGLNSKSIGINNVDNSILIPSGNATMCTNTSNSTSGDHDIIIVVVKRRWQKWKMNVNQVIIIVFMYYSFLITIYFGIMFGHYLYCTSNVCYIFVK